MRPFVYVVAAVAALGIMAGIVMMPGDPTDTQEASTVDANPVVMEESGTLTVAVPDMHCEMACFPKVKKALEESGDVSEVVYDTKTEDDGTEKRQVLVKYEPGFNVSAALENLASSGYESEVVQ